MKSAVSRALTRDPREVPIEASEKINEPGSSYCCTGLRRESSTCPHRACNQSSSDQFARFGAAEQVETHIAFLRTSEHYECLPIALSTMAMDLVRDAMNTGDSYMELLRRHYKKIPMDDPSKQMLQAVTLLSLLHEMGLFVDKVPLPSGSNPVAAAC